MSTPFAYAPGSHSFLAWVSGVSGGKGEEWKQKRERELKGRPDTQANSFRTLNTRQGKKGLQHTFACTYLVCHTSDKAHIIITIVFEVVQVQLLQRKQTLKQIKPPKP